MKEPLFLTLDELAWHCRLKRDEARQLVERGELPPPVEIGGRQRWRTADLEAIGAHKAKTADEVWQT